MSIKIKISLFKKFKMNTIIHKNPVLNKVLQSFTSLTIQGDFIEFLINSNPQLSSQFNDLNNWAIIKLIPKNQHGRRCRG